MTQFHMSKMSAPPWIDINDAAPLFGMNAQSILNAIGRGTFPCPSYKLGKRRVFDREVMAAYFAKRRDEGLKELAKAKKP